MEKERKEGKERLRDCGREKAKTGGRKLPPQHGNMIHTTKYMLEAVMFCGWAYPCLAPLVLGPG